MYRIFKATGISLQNSCKMPNTQYSPKVCLFCNFYHLNTLRFFTRPQLRHHSSFINSIMLTVGKKKLKRKAKKYAELLEVTDCVTNNRKAAVQNLNAAQLSILVGKPEITLDKLHKIKGKRSSKKSETDKSLFSTSTSETSTTDQLPTSLEKSISEFPSTYSTTTIPISKQDNYLNESYIADEKELLIEELQLSGILDETELIKSASLMNSEINENEEHIINDNIKLIESEKSTQSKRPGKKINDEEQKYKEASIHKDKIRQYNKVLLGYMDVCVNSNFQVNFYDIYKKNKKNLYLNDIIVFNVQIRKLAHDCDLKNILKILEYLRKEKIKLIPQTYAYIFECIGRMNDSDENKLAILKLIEIEMKTDGISLNDIITKSTFVRDQKVFVDKIIKLLNNEFEPVYNTPDTTYDCRLLERLCEEDATPSSTVKDLLNKNNFEDRLKKQIELEIDGQVTVRTIAKQNTSKKNVTYWRNKVISLEKTWRKVALTAFKRNLETLKSTESFNTKTKIMLSPYLSVLKPEEYVSILMREVQKLGMGSEMYSLPFNALCHHVGQQVYKKYEATVKQNDGIIDKVSEVYLKYYDWFTNRNEKMNSRVKWALLEHEANKQGTTLGVEVPSWHNNIHLNIGKFLLNIMVNDLKVDSNYGKKKKGHHSHHLSAFFKIYRHSGVRLKEELKPHPVVSIMYRDSLPETLNFDVTLIPSLCPPRPWVSAYNGGYIIAKTDIVRVNHMDNQQWDRLVSSPPKKLYPALDSLNQLGSIPWTVNQAVLDVAIEVFQNDGSVELNVPQPPTVLTPIPPAPKNASPAEKKKIDKQRMELRRKKNEMYSLWCDSLYRLSLANHFRNEIFWLPHNMDFRGRVYPIPPHLNHLGSDLARSMLVFALKKPLGPNGLDWLKLHTINLTGFKKREPIRERLKYANEIMDKILDSAERPLTGERWWVTSDEPWQTLSACMEIAAALKSPNPEEFMSGFPIHQDGSCNGLQHYAALGRDQIGAESVNLHPSDSPQDVYSSVAAMVDEKRQLDAKKGNSIAMLLDGFITRKVIKQTVMTTVYGVTWFGAKLQIARQLKDIDEFPQQHLWPASTYLVQKTFQTLRTMFKSAREIQDWFTECARLVCMAREQNMEWVTPLGLPVVQPYSKVHRPTCGKMSLNSLFTSDIYRNPNVMKQKNAFAPNFVHSLDSSHMMLTSIHCEHAGITFISVHDCYWTHPSSVELMNKICREQFVALHSEPILDDLSKFLIEKFGYEDLDGTEPLPDTKVSNKDVLKKKLNSTLSNVPKQGTFDLKGVLSSTYFFS